MDNVNLIATNLPSRNCQLIVLPDSSHTDRSAVYVFYKGKRLAYTFQFNIDSQLSNFVELHTLLFPSYPLEIFTLGSYHCVLLEGGCIYRIPDIVGKVTATLPKSSSISTASSLDVDIAWPKATCVPESCKLFQNKNCTTICSLRDVAFILFTKQLQSSVNIYKCGDSSSNDTALRLINRIHLPHLMKKSLKPCMTSFLLGDGSGKNEIDSQLCQHIFGDKLSIHSVGVVLLSICNGEVFFIPVGNDLMRNVCAYPLFCFHEPVVKIQKILVKTDNSRNEVGILFVGVSGKLIVLSRSNGKPQEAGSSITEFHVPGPVHLWAECGGIAFHTDGTSSLWKTVFKKQNNQDDDANIISVSTSESIRACGICLFYSHEQSTHGFLYTENGNLLFIKNCDKFGLTTSELCSTLQPMDLKNLLTAIHECSDELTKIYQHQESEKKILSEVSCAAHLILNDKVRKTFNFTVIPKWTSAESNQIIIAVKLENVGDFRIVGNHWHFVFTIITASGCCFTKSIPLNGFEPGNKIDAKIKIKVGDIVTDNGLPFAVTGGLQLFMDFHQESMMDVHLESSGYEPPVSFFVKLSEISLDELGFFCIHMDDQFMQCDPSIFDALWELARSRPAIVFHDLENLLQMPLETSSFNFVTVKKTSIEKLLKKQGFPEGTLLASCLAYIISDSKIVLPNDFNEAELSIFGHKVKLIIREDGVNLQIKIMVWCPSLLPKLRYAILRKLQFINYQTIGTTISRQKQIEGFVVKPTVLKSCLTLNSRLHQLSSLQQENRNNLVSHIYAEMRELVSSELPFV